MNDKYLKIPIPKGYRRLEAGEIIEKGDVYSSHENALLDCWSSVGYAYLMHPNGFDCGNYAVFRHISREPKKGRSFYVGETVISLHSGMTRGKQGVIHSVFADNKYLVRFEEGSVVLLCAAYLEANKIAGRNVEIKPDGLQIGCTFVSDEEIKLAAKLRGII